MPTKISSGAITGIDGVTVEVETDITPGLPTMVIVGLPDTAVQEARERVKSAIKNSGFSFPRSRVAVNLAPADLPKSGSLYDLPIAVSILVEEGLINIPPEALASSLFLGELALDGRIRPVGGVLPVAIAAARAGLANIFVPKNNAAEASLVKKINVYPAETLTELVAHLENRVKIKSVKLNGQSVTSGTHAAEVDFADVAGQQAAKRALVIAAAGHHNVLLSGPPGSGKTMLARALAGILPPLSESELLDVTKIYSIAGLLFDKSKIILSRPFRSPHHTSSRISLVGGGTHPKPGEVTLAHRGVLFLDEFPEFPRSSLDSLRQPIEDGRVTVSRVAGTSLFPAEFILVAAQNPCPCGNFGNAYTACVCPDAAIRRYRTRVSGPILDRIDLTVEVPYQPYEKLKNTDGVSSEELAKIVLAARTKQQTRLNSDKTNSRLQPNEIKKFCALNEPGERLMAAAVNKLHLSARAYHRILKVARTIADLDGQENIGTQHLSEALQYRIKQE